MSLRSPLRTRPAHHLALLVSASALLLAGCSGDDLDSESASDEASKQDSAEAVVSESPASRGEVRISGQSFPEAQLVTAMYDEILTDAGFSTQIDLVDTRDVYMQIFPDDVDVVPEYVGGIVDYLNTTVNGADAESLTTADAEESISAAEGLLDDAGITLLDPSQATDTNAFFVTEAYADDQGVSTLSDLEGTSVVLAAAPDCEGRPDCEGGLTGTYGIDVTKILPTGFATDQTYQSVLDGESQLGLTSTTDGTLDAQGLVLLEDDQQIQPAQNLVPAVSTAFLEGNPDLEDLLGSLMEALTTENLTELNGRVSVDREEAADVARDFLLEEGLIQEQPTE